MEPLLSPSEALPESHIVPGNFLWYGGQTSMFGWDCPAQIMVVDQVTRTFTVMSLDDLKHQGQVYTFDVLEHSPESRRSMRAITSEEAAKYLRGRAADLQDRVSEIPAEIAALEQRMVSRKKTIAGILKLATEADPSFPVG